MRDSFGGVFTLNVMLVFIFIFVAFAAVSLNYAKAFRLKNSVISFIEENEIIELSEDGLTGISDIISNANYNKTCDTIGELEDNAYCQDGVVIEILEETPVEGTTSRIITYQVITYADWNLGALNKILVLGGRAENSESPIINSWQIKGEAKVITIG